MIPHDGELIASKPPKFRLDLHVDPYHRWDHIIPAFKDEIQCMAATIIDPLGIPDSVYESLGLMWTLKYEYKDFVKELKGIGNISGVRWEKIMIANFFYEISTINMCTSIVARNKDNKILHGRNLDFRFYKWLSKLSAVVDVYKGDRYIGTWDQLIGSVLVLSGTSLNSFTVSVDTRHDGNLEDVLDNLFKKQYVPSAYLTRQILEAEMSYEEALYALKTTNISSRIYYIIGGITQGAVIERNPVGYKGFQQISDKNWYIVQTNYDQGEDPSKDDRKTPAVLRMEEIGQENINENNLFDLLKKYPTLNLHTLYSVIMSAEYNYNKISLWYGNIDDFDGPPKVQEDPYIKKLEEEDVEYISDEKISKMIKTTQEFIHSFNFQITEQ